MENNEEYQHVPKSKLADMEKELRVLKNARAGKGVTNEELQVSIERLTSGMEQMMKIFKMATEQIQLEDHDQDTVSQRLAPIIEKIDRLAEQNEKIADGVVAVADMIKDHMANEMNEFKTVENKIGMMSMPPPTSMPTFQPMQGRGTGMSGGPIQMPDDMGAGFNDDFGMPPMPPPGKGRGGMPPMPPPRGMGSGMPPPPPNMDFGSDMPPFDEDFGTGKKKKGLFGFGK